MRAVSSPSFCENPIETIREQSLNYHQNNNVNEQLINTEADDLDANQNVSGSVLQKFKKTLSHLKGKPSSSPSILSSINNNNNNNFNNNINNNNNNNNNNQHENNSTTNGTTVGGGDGSNESSKYRFGPLIWRTSKERRQTKHHRSRDKCNSGDSGIQIELENDDYLINDGGGENSGSGGGSGGVGGGGSSIISTIGGRSNSIEISPSYNIRVRRANSAKITSASSTSVKAKALKKQEGIEKLNSTPLPGRSLSQPSGLDRITKDPDDSDTDSDCLHDRLNNEGLQSIFAEVLYPFKPIGPQELALEKGALVEILRRDPGPWWWGQIKHDAIIRNSSNDLNEGWFPKDFVRIIPSFPKPNIKKPTPQQQQQQQQQQLINHDMLQLVTTDDKNCDINILNKSNAGTNKQDIKMSNISTVFPSSSSSSTANLQQNYETIRESVTKELLETEINYVKLLSSLCIGYLKGLRQRPDIFPTESLILIFSNIEKIWRFQQTFLDALKIAVQHNRIAETFLEFQTAFMVYSTYCNSYPKALVELDIYAGNIDAITLLENCRVSQNLPELPLQAHLLAPIQRICRYPLHLIELVKYTACRQDILRNNNNKIDLMMSTLTTKKCNENDMIDCKETFELALVAMKRVTEMVNEGKRHSEYLTRIQARFDNFQGPAINIHSSRLFLQTDAIRMTPNLWNNTYTLFLFDRQLIYCKKDLLKRTHYIYKGRIFLDNCRILNIPDGKMFGFTLKNALRIYCDTRNKWFDFCFRSNSSKLRFLNTLSAERQFCGQNLFVSELAGTDDDNLSDRDYNSDRGGSESTKDLIGTDDVSSITYNISNENINTAQTTTSLNIESQPLLLDKSKKSDTLPKKSRKLSKDQLQLQNSNSMDNNNNNNNINNNDKNTYEYHTHSLGRRKIGNWFRKAKSTNTTPSQSPTHSHQQHSFITSVHTTTTNSDSSSHSSSPALSGFRQTNKAKMKDGIIVTPS